MSKTNNYNKLINNIFNDLNNFISNMLQRHIQYIKQHMINNFVSLFLNNYDFKNIYNKISYEYNLHKNFKIQLKCKM